MRHYTYRHYPGYSRLDHLADEIIARALRDLGYATDDLIRSHCGFSGGPAPSVDVRIPAQRGVAVRMRAALIRARKDVGCSGIGPCIQVIAEA